MDQENLTTPRQTLVDKIKQSKSILVTVSNNPSVDQLAACLGLTLWLNKSDLHATAVFSGEVPSTLEFLQPEATLEKNTDSLRDFIISLDKSKADKLRYKVEENVVKVFVTPYRTSLTAGDLEYSQGDFNVDMVIALGVSNQADLDGAVTAHGRILHDAAVASITTGDTAGDLGSIQWHDPQTSSLSELVVGLGNDVDKTHLDNQIATALLTGIVAQTDRFSNDKTTPQTMSVSAELMSAGANQQLVVSKLETIIEPELPAEPESEPAEQSDEEATDSEPADQPPVNEDGALSIEHEDKDEAAEDGQADETPVADDGADEAVIEADADETGDDKPTDDEPVADEPVTEDPTSDDSAGDAAAEPDEQLATDTDDDTAKTEPAVDEQVDEPQEPAEDTSDPAAEPAEVPTPTNDEQADSADPADLQPAPPSWMPQQPWMQPTDDNPVATPAVADGETLAEIEQSVESPHIAEEIAVEEAERPDLDAARDEVMRAIGGAPSNAAPEPTQALNAQPIDLDQPTPSAPGAVTDMPTPQPPTTDPNQPADPELTGPVEQPFTMPLPDSLNLPPANPVPPTSAASDPTAPPPVPPPLPFAPANQQK